MSASSCDGALLPERPGMVGAEHRSRLRLPAGLALILLAPIFAILARSRSSSLMVAGTGLTSGLLFGVFQIGRGAGFCGFGPGRRPNIRTGRPSMAVNLPPSIGRQPARSVTRRLRVGKHPLQLYSQGRPNGVKIKILLEELLALGHRGARLASG